MTIDANLIEGVQIGFGFGVFFGAALTGAVIYYLFGRD